MSPVPAVQSPGASSRRSGPIAGSLPTGRSSTPRHRLASEPMEDATFPLMLAVAGVLAGLALLWRGFVAHGTAIRVADTATSRIATLAAGEVRGSGVVEPAEVTLVSPLQRIECVWYRSRVSSGDGGGGGW